MAQKTIAYNNGKGDLFPTAEDATVSDLTILLGNVQFARDVLEKRAEIEALFDQHDFMLEAHILVKDPSPAA